MVALFYLILFLGLGHDIAGRLLPEATRLVRLWAGCVLGLVGAMWAVVPFAFVLGYTPPAHAAGLALMIAVAWAIARFRPAPARTPWLAPGDGLPVLAAGGFMLMLDALLFTHVLVPGPDGLYGGQSTFGDLAMHLGMITSLAYQGHFPPEYSIHPGHALNYPFLVNALSASLVRLGLPLREAVLVPSFLLAFAVTFGFACLARELLRCGKAAALAVVLFFLNGGFGFMYFLDGAKADPQRFSRIFDAFYQTPTNLTKEGIYWVNVLADMLVPQRTTLAGWAVVIFLLWLLLRAQDARDRRLFALAGVVAGLLPMIHTHSYLGLGILTVTWAIAFWPWAPDRRAHAIDWAIFGALAMAIAAPQLFFWTFQQATEGRFVKFQPDWVNQQDPWLWFWVKNVGVPFLLVVPAFLAARRRMAIAYVGALAVFVVADLVLFQRNAYDNNKLFYLWYMLTAILVAGYLGGRWLSGARRPERWAALGVVVILATSSALLTLGREFRSSYMLFSRAQVAAAEFARTRTPPESLFLTSDNHNNAIAALAGRSVYWGTSTYLFFHGIETQDRERVVRKMLGSPEAFERLAPAAGIDYAYVSSYERSRLSLDARFFEGRYPKVFQTGDVTIFAVSERARALAERHRKL